VTEHESAPSEHDGAPRDPIRRPGPHRWIWYAFGGRLPARHRGWVLHDTTTRTWAARHLARATVQLSVPVGLVLLLTPAPFWVRGMAAIGGVLLALIFSVGYMTETAENRAVRAGYPPGTAETERDRQALLRQQRDAQRRQAAGTQRAARYRARSGR
jgi:hypothetical protein